MNTPTFILSLVLLGIMGLIVRNILRNKKRGGCAGCPHASACGRESCR